MNIACIDMEGVLIPELWPHVAKLTGISELKITTRDFPNYEKLVNNRIEILKKNSIKLCDLQAFICDIKPLDGAVDFLNKLKLNFNVILVSDAFREMITPLWVQLGKPELKCHRFVCDELGYASQAIYSRQHGKHEGIEEFAAKGYQTIAVGDAFNDFSMLRCADAGFLFRPSAETLRHATGITVVNSYEDILDAVSHPGGRVSFCEGRVSTGMR